MGLLQNIGQKFSNTVWESVNNMTNSLAETANSFLYSGAAILNTGIGSNGTGQFNEFATATYFDYLKPYHFLSSILDIFVSCILDVISKSDFHVSIVNDEEHTNRANNFIDEIQLKRFVIDNLRDMIYHGVYAFGIDYQQKRLYSLTNPYDCKIITNTRDIIGYELNGNLVSTDNIICYYYKLLFSETIGSVSEDANPYSILSSKAKIKQDDTNSDIPEELRGLIVKFKKYNVQGLFDNKLFRLFQAFSKEQALYYMSLRESVRPTLLGVRTGGKAIKITEAIDMANSIEQVLNEHTSGLAQISDPIVYMNQLVWTMLNNIRVMPTLEQYDSISDLAQNSIADRIDKMSTELDNIKKEILNELTIPEDLFGGTSNRWEAYGRGDRFMSTIDSILTSISTMVKQVICKYTGISTVSISFNIDTTALSVSFDTKDKVSRLGERLSETQKVLESFKDILDSEFIVPNAAYQYLYGSLNAIDEKLGSIIVKEYGQVDEESEGGEEGGSDFDDEGGFEL